MLLLGPGAGKIAILCLFAGGIATLVGLTLLPGPTWAAFLANFLYWTGLAQAGVLVAAVFNLTRSRWGRTVQQIALGMGAFLPISLLLLGIVWLGRGTFLTLAVAADTATASSQASPPTPASARSPWLDETWLFARIGAGLLLVIGLSMAYLYHSFRPERDERWLRALSMAVVISYFPAYSLLAIDLSMTLSPAFASTIYPVIYLIGQFYAAVGMTAVLVALFRQWEPAHRIIGPGELLDLGNLLWGFAIFWAYLLGSQYFQIWMANLPHEVAHQAARWHAPGARRLAWVVLACGFILPFLALFSRALKRSGPLLGAIGLISALAILLERFLDVIPALPWPATLGTVLLQGAITLGFAGLFALPYRWLMRRAGLFPVTDPLLAEQLATRHVEA